MRDIIEFVGDVFWAIIATIEVFLLMIAIPVLMVVAAVIVFRFAGWIWGVIF